SVAGSSVAPIVHLHQPREPQPSWQAIAIAGALALQFLLVALIAWRTLVPPSAASSGDSQIVAALERLDATLETRRRADLAEERVRARMEFLDDAFRELKGTDAGAISKLQSQFDKTAERAADVAARDAQIREMQISLEKVRGDFVTSQ